MIIRSLLALFVLAAGPGLAAGGALTTDMDFAAVYGASLESMGGLDAVNSVHSIKASAVCVSPQGQYGTELQSARGNMFFFRQTQPSGPAFQAYLVPGQSVSMDNRGGGPVPLKPEAVAVIRAHDFQMMALEFDQRFRDIAVRGEEMFGGSRCLALSMVDELGAPATGWYRMGSGLLAGFETRNPIDTGTVRVQILDWMDVDGVKLPSHVIATDTAGDFVLRFTEISTNGVPEEAFQAPR